LDKLKKRIIEKVIWLRLAQMLTNEQLKKGVFKIPVHLALGHESIAVAVDHVMKENDSLFLTHRNIHYNLARMCSLKEELDEFKLLKSGLSRGKLGSMNMTNPAKNIIYTSSILGNNMPVATGFALGNKFQQKKDVVFVVTGDGAIEEGSFYESLLFLKSNDLSVVIIVENNQWSLGTKISERRASIDLDKLANALGIEFISLNGNDPIQYINEINSCRNNSIETSTPVLIEAQLTTLGYWFAETEEFPDGKFINYHAGHAPEVNNDGYPLITPTVDDPIHVLSKYVSKDEIIKISKNTMKHLEAEIA
jgi:TPP-dependent pyruvate/acetoin dehydrogenase alpha subunit